MTKLDGANHVTIGTFHGFKLAIDKIHNGFVVSAAVSLRKKLPYTEEAIMNDDEKQEQDVPSQKEELGKSTNKRKR